MLKRRIAPFILSVGVCMVACDGTPLPGDLDSLTGEPINVAGMEARITAIMEKGACPACPA